MNVSIFAILLLACPLWSQCQRIHPVAGPYRVIPRRIVRCPPEKEGLRLLDFFVSFRRLRSDSSKYSVTGNMTFGVDYCNENSVSAHFATWSNTAGWKENAVVISHPRQCEATALFVKRQFISLTKTAAGEVMTCPVLKGPFRVVNRGSEQCPPDKIGLGLLEHYLRTRRLRSNSSKYSATGNITLKVDYSNENSISAHFATWSNTAGWKENAVVVNHPRQCDATRLFVKSQFAATTTAIAGEVMPCPILKGVYRFANATIDLSIDTVKNFFYGRWRLDVLMKKKNVILGCLRVFVDTVPLVKRPTTRRKVVNEDAN